MALIIGLAFIVSARGDLTIVQRIEGAGQNGNTTVKVKADKERIDAPEKPSQIIDGKTGEMTELINDRKLFVKISAAQIKAAAESIAKFGGADKSPAPKLKPTGKKETINGYETEEFVYETPQFKASFWVAIKYPDAANILKQMQAPVSGVWKPSSMGLPDYSDFTGMPLKTVISMGDNQMTTTVVSIKKDPVSAAEFEIPKDFQELKQPAEGAPPPAGKSAASPAPTP